MENALLLHHQFRAEMSNFMTTDKSAIYEVSLAGWVT
jgi:hypothetical protein